MKKILIALPLVLIMLLSLVPVMAESVEYEVVITPVAKFTRADKNVDVTYGTAKTFKVKSNDDGDAISDKDLGAINLWLNGLVKELQPENSDYIIHTTFAAADLKPAAGDDKNVKKEAEFKYEEKKAVPTECPKQCEEIKVTLRDVSKAHNVKNVIMDEYAVKYGVENNQIPNFEGIVNDYLDTYFPWGSWMIVKAWHGGDAINLPGDMLATNKCTIIIDVIPAFKNISIVHELWDCCVDKDGNTDWSLARTFVEEDVPLAAGLDGLVKISWVDYMTKLTVNQEAAAEIAKNRITKLNAGEYVFQEAIFHENLNLTAYMTGKVYDLNGKEIREIKAKNPVILLKYKRAECLPQEETEAKVDDAKLVAGAETTTNAPAAQQLPATGAKDVTAFFMSAVALLGLGIFFAKKH